jgi:hypothetical protein
VSRQCLSFAEIYWEYREGDDAMYSTIDELRHQVSEKETLIKYNIGNKK